MPFVSVRTSNTTSSDTLFVEVAYADLGSQATVPLVVPRGITIKDAILRSGILARFPEIDLALNKVGVYGKLRTLTSGLREGDRVEIYRPLVADPKEARQQRAVGSKPATA